jgi:hypothetical protein
MQRQDKAKPSLYITSDSLWILLTLIALWMVVLVAAFMHGFICLAEFLTLETSTVASGILTVSTKWPGFCFRVRPKTTFFKLLPVHILNVLGVIAIVPPLCITINFTISYIFLTTQ